MEKEKMNWGEYFNYINVLRKKMEKRIEPEPIFLGLGRGGLIPLGMLSHSFNIERTYHVGLKNTRWDKNSNSSGIIEYSSVKCLGAIIGGRRLFIIDDLIDSGESVNYIINNYSVYCKDIVVCCLIDKVYNNNLRYKVEVLTARELDERKWIIFPYEH